MPSILKLRGRTSNVQMLYNGNLHSSFHFKPVLYTVWEDDRLYAIMQTDCQTSLNMHGLLSLLSLFNMKRKFLTSAKNRLAQTIR